MPKSPFYKLDCYTNSIKFMKRRFTMTGIEIVFSVIGIGIIIGGFVYAIYDSYCQSKDYRTSRKK